MVKHSILAAILSPLLMASSCGGSSSTGGGEPPVSTPAPSPSATFTGFDITAHGTFKEPWASAFVPGTDILVITEKPGKLVGIQTGNNDLAITFTGVPQVDYGGQGGLGEVAFLPGEADTPLSGRTIFLTWAEAGSGDTRGAVLGRGTLSCDGTQSCAIEGLDIIWRQTPKVTGRGHYSHRIAFAPDGQTLFLSSGDRQKGDPAQDLHSDLGKIVHLNLDGTPAAGNTLSDDNVAEPELYSYGHRNVLGLAFDAAGRLWGVEHGPAGGDELNLIENGANYGWPLRSNGDQYDGTPIPDHSPDDGFSQPAISWTPVIAPGNLMFYSGDLFPGLKGDALIAGLKTKALIRVGFDGTAAREVARYDMGRRIRSVIEGPGGALWVLEDGAGGRLLELRPR